jgi:ABC-type cobalamin/Fe3+-siderophores transport system ATPase subunit
MTNPHLKKLTIKHLRGSMETFILEFEKKKLTIIYGENGTGKSTICDAFEFIGKGKIGSIEGRGLGKTSEYWPSIGRKLGDILVTLETSSGSCSACFQSSEVSVSPVDSNPKIEILRRRQILSLIEAQPNKRYEVIKRFIDVSGIEDSEVNLKNLIKSLKSDNDKIVARIQENLQTIENFYLVAEIKNKDILIWAEEEVSRDFSLIEQELKCIAQLKSSYEAIARQLDRMNQATVAVESAEEKYNKVKIELSNILASASEDASDLLTLWKAAQLFFNHHPEPNVCPLCQSSENVLDLATSITEKITQFSALNIAVRDKEIAERELQKVRQNLQSATEEIEILAHNFENICLVGSIAQDVRQPEDSVPRLSHDLSIWLEQTKQFPDQWLELERQKQDKKQFFATLKKALETYHENIQQQQELEILIPRLEQTLKAIEEERRKFTDEVLSNIANEVGRIYEVIHPGEGLNKISLQLDPKKRASLGIDAEFGSSRVPPQAYFSESHLDTLGLCIFLALAGLEIPENTILILDDVLASVDEPHVERLINMLYDETQRFHHCVITTHYRPWKQKLRWGWLQHGQCHFVELTKWSAAQGLTLIRSTPDIQRLRELLSETPPDPQLVCSKAGVILEATLDFLTQLYECKVPCRPDNRYTLGDLLPSVDKRLRNALKVEVLDKLDANGNPVYKTKNLVDIINEIERIAQARNVFGAHFNTLSFDLLENDALGFGQAVLELVEILIDPDKGWPRSSKSGSYWSTSGETRRLHPLKNPG